MSNNIVNEEIEEMPREESPKQIMRLLYHGADENPALCNTAYSFHNYSKMEEVCIIQSMISFLEANGGAGIEQSVLRKMAEALTKSINYTNPNLFQDVTTDNTYGVGYRSACVSLQQYHGATSQAVQGRSVREVEEHTAALCKENFNLKLRLYFIEENIPALKSNGADDCDTVMRELIEHKVEVEVLRKELEAKKTVLKDALQAIEDLENIQKETEMNYEVKIDDLKHKIQSLEVNRNGDKSVNNDFISTMPGRSDIVTEHVNNLQMIRELETLIKTHEDSISELEYKVTFLDGILAKRDHTIQKFEDKIKSLEYKNAELQEQIDEKNKDSASSEHLRDELRKNRVEIADKICMIDELEEKLAKMQRSNEQACRTIQALTQIVKHQQSAIKVVNKKHNTSGNSDPTSLNRSLSDTDALAGDISKRDWETKIELQEGVIKSLRTEVKKKTADLQNLVNKELWDKNREIERLTKLLNDRNPKSVVSPTSKTSRSELQQSFTELEYAEALERNTSLQLKVDTIIQRLGIEVREARIDAENAERFRRECDDVFAVLTKRLEELAGFLNSLLKHKDLLGFLAADSRRAIRKAVDRSLDLSKSLNRTLSLSGVSMAEYSLTQLCNLSEILGDVSSASIDIAETTNVVESIEKSIEPFDDTRAIETLKAENKALKKESKKDHRSIPAAAIAALENQSESEAWSEPDRKVSLARIGLEVHSASLLVSKDLSATQVGLQDIGSESDTDAGDVLNHSCTAKMRAQQQEAFAQLKQLVAQRDERILQIQCQLVDADNRLKKEKLRVIDPTQEVEELRERNNQLHTHLITIDASTQHDRSSITQDGSIWIRQIEEQAQLLENIQDECDRRSIEARIATQQIGELKSKLEKMRIEHEVALKAANEQERQHLEELRKKMEAEMRKQLEEQQELQTEALDQLTEECNAQRMNNSSPDLGIESDPGRVSSVELTNMHRSLLMKIEVPKSESQNNDVHSDDEKKILHDSANLDTENRPPNGNVHDCEKVEQELSDLRRKLIRTKRALEHTYQELRNSNQIKAQIERDIKNQITKTHNVLNNVRSNMELEK